MQMDTMSLKEAITAELEEMARLDKRIVAVTSDARGSSSLTAYTKALPEQFVECGIAEQDEVGIAAGLASVGKHSYVFAPACFLSARSLEQVKVDVAYSRQNVKIVGVSGGVSYGALGASHHSLHDIAVMRSLPGLAVILPSDAAQAQAMLHDVEERGIGAYIRVGKAKLPTIYGKGGLAADFCTEIVSGNDSTHTTAMYQDGGFAPARKKPFTFGKANILRDGLDITIIATGECTCHAVMAADALKEKGVAARMLDMPCLKPFDSEAVAQAASETKCIVTVEEHSINGGLGAAVAQAVCASSHPVRVKCLGFPDEHTVAGTQAEVFKHYGLDAAGIEKACVEFIKEQ